MSKRWRLDVYAEPTPRRPPSEAVAEALYALQIEATHVDVEEITNSPFAAPLVAIVKHLERSSGKWQVVELADAPSFLDEDSDPVAEERYARRPRIEDVIQGG